MQGGRPWAQQGRRLGCGRTAEGWHQQARVRRQSKVAEKGTTKVGERQAAQHLSQGWLCRQGNLSPPLHFTFDFAGACWEKLGALHVPCALHWCGV